MVSQRAGSPTRLARISQLPAMREKHLVPQAGAGDPQPKRHPEGLPRGPNPAEGERRNPASEIRTGQLPRHLPCRPGEREAHLSKDIRARDVEKTNLKAHATELIEKTNKELRAIHGEGVQFTSKQNEGTWLPCGANANIAAAIQYLTLALKEMKKHKPKS